MNLSQYKKPALQFSGGKDSLACLYLLKDQLDKIDVYYLSTGDECPETKEVVESVRRWIPRFIEIESNSSKWRAENGLPTDLAPANSHPIGVEYGIGKFVLSNRFDCCFHNIIKPMHDRMVADGVDAVIRGAKTADTGKQQPEGKMAFYDIILPIKDWTHDEVFRYLQEVGAPENQIYGFGNGESLPNCFSCTAWWSDGTMSKYLKALHPDEYAVYLSRLQLIKAVIGEHVASLYAELDGA